MRNEVTIGMIGLKVINEENKIYLTRYKQSKNWTIPNILINNSDQNTAFFIRCIFSLLPSGVEVISVMKNLDLIDVSEIWNDSRTYTVVQSRKTTIYNVKVEVVGDQEIKAEFDQQCWLSEKNFCSMTLLNRLTKSLVNQEEILLF